MFDGHQNQISVEFGFLYFSGRLNSLLKFIFEYKARKKLNAPKTETLKHAIKTGERIDSKTSVKLF